MTTPHSPSNLKGEVTEAQKNFLRILARERLAYFLGSTPDERVERIESMFAGMSKAQASTMIGDVKELDKDPALLTQKQQVPASSTAQAAATLAGSSRRPYSSTGQYSSSGNKYVGILEPNAFYKVDADLYRTKQSKMSGNIYALKLNTANRDWEYSQHLADVLVEALNVGTGKSLSLEEAAKLGLHLGWCIVCGKDLTDSLSVKVGIGPKCIKRWGVTQLELARKWGVA